MIWNEHKNCEGRHAFFGASQFRWLNWDDQTVIDRFYGQYAQLMGTALHLLAHECIMARIKLNRNDKHLIDYTLFKAGIPKNAYDSEKILENLIPFVNDAIGFHMYSELVLYYSDNCFGTTDAIVYNEKTRNLRIHDLKTGETPADIMQEMIYAALFYLEYKMKPKDNTTILVIYQFGKKFEHTADPMEIEKIMEIIQNRDAFVQVIKGANYK